MSASRNWRPLVVPCAKVFHTFPQECAWPPAFCSLGLVQRTVDDVAFHSLSARPRLQVGQGTNLEDCPFLVDGAPIPSHDCAARRGANRKGRAHQS
jgi:hypothetical protein